MVKVIKTWEELAELEESETHKIQIEKDPEDSAYDTYWIRNKKTGSEYYLSTHTFYGGEPTKEINRKLKHCGFNAQIITEEN